MALLAQRTLRPSLLQAAPKLSKSPIKLVACSPRPRAKQQRLAQAAPAEADSSAAADSPYEFSCIMSVRDYELDQYSVVNNSVYANYLQHVRHEFLTHVGISADVIAQQGDALALSELHMTYRQPLRSGDKFRGTCRVVKATGARLIMAQQVYRLPKAGEGGGETLALSAEAVVVSLDKNYRPKRLSAVLRDALVSGNPLSEEDRPHVQELL